MTRSMILLISLDPPVGAAGGCVMGGGHSAFSPPPSASVPIFPFIWPYLNLWYDDTSIVTSTTYQTRPTFPMTGASILSNFTSPRTYQITSNPLQCRLGWTYRLIEFLLSDPRSSQRLLGRCQNAFSPIRSYVEDATGGSVTNFGTSTTVPFPTFYEFYTTLFSGTSGISSWNYITTASSQFGRDWLWKCILSLYGDLQFN